MAFRPYSAGTGTDHSELVTVPMYNSTTIAVGDAVLIGQSDTTGGYAQNAAAGYAVFGIAVGFAKPEGTPLAPSAYVAGTATSTDVQTVTSASDNTTTFADWVIVETSPFKKWSVDVTGTLGTTAVSPTAATKRVGGWINVDSAGGKYGYVLETTFIRARSAGTVQNFYCWGVDPGSTSRLVVSISSTERICEQK